MAYKYFQPNKKDIKDKYSDCVIRALCKATGKDWATVFNELIPISLEVQSMPNSKQVYERYLKQQGFKYQGISNAKGTKRPTVKSFSFSNKNIVAVLRVSNHLVTCSNGDYFDTWDSGNKSMYGYWYK